jgi:hypothetical protein
MVHATEAELVKIKQVIDQLNAPKSDDPKPDTTVHSPATSHASSPTTNDDLITRNYRIDAATFVKNIHWLHPESIQPGVVRTTDKKQSDDQNVLPCLESVLRSSKIELASLIYNPVNGMILARGTSKNMKSLEDLLSTLSSLPPQIQITCQLWTAPNIEWMEQADTIRRETVSPTVLGKPDADASLTNHIERAFSTILSYNQAEQLKDRLSETEEAKLWNAPSVVTLDRRQAHVSVSERPQKPGSASIDLIPTIETNTLSTSNPPSIAMVAIAEYVSTNISQLMARRSVQDGQSLLLAGYGRTTENEKPLGYVILITPVIIDATGNRVYPNH